jgi:hypothetical protein
MPLLAAQPVTVLPDQREVLEQLVRTHSTPQQLAMRARLILHAADAMGVHASARELGVWPKRCGIGASDGGRRTTSGLSSSGWPMHRGRDPRRRSRPNRYARWWR